MRSWKTQWLRDDRSFRAVRATERLAAAVCSNPSTFFFGGGGEHKQQDRDTPLPPQKPLTPLNLSFKEGVGVEIWGSPYLLFGGDGDTTQVGDVQFLAGRADSPDFQLGSAFRPASQQIP